MRFGVLNLSLAIWTTYLSPGIELCPYNAEEISPQWLSLSGLLCRLIKSYWELVRALLIIDSIGRQHLFPHATGRLSHWPSPHIESSHHIVVCAMA